MHSVCVGGARVGVRVWSGGWGPVGWVGNGHGNRSCPALPRTCLKPPPPVFLPCPWHRCQLGEGTHPADVVVVFDILQENLLAQALQIRRIVCRAGGGAGAGLGFPVNGPCSSPAGMLAPSVQACPPFCDSAVAMPGCNRAPALAAWTPGPGSRSHGHHSYHGMMLLSILTRFCRSIPRCQSTSG